MYDIGGISSWSWPHGQWPMRRVGGHVEINRKRYMDGSMTDRRSILFQHICLAVKRQSEQGFVDHSSRQNNQNNASNSMFHLSSRQNNASNSMFHRPRSRSPLAAGPFHFAYYHCYDHDNYDDDNIDTISLLNIYHQWHPTLANSFCYWGIITSPPAHIPSHPNSRECWCRGRCNMSYVLGI